MKRISILLLMFITFGSLSFAQDIEIDDDEPEAAEEVFEFYQVQEKAAFIGGEDSMFKFVSKNLIMPDSIISGMVPVSFVVEKNGSLTEVKVDSRLKRANYTPAMAKASVEVVQKMSGMWEPALQRDKPVRMRFLLPIKFVAEK